MGEPWDQGRCFFLREAKRRMRDTAWVALAPVTINSDGTWQGDAFFWLR